MLRTGVAEDAHAHDSLFTFHSSVLASQASQIWGLLNSVSNTYNTHRCKMACIVCQRQFLLN